MPCLDDFFLDLDYIFAMNLKNTITLPPKYFCNKF